MKALGNRAIQHFSNLRFAEGSPNTNRLKILGPGMQTLNTQTYKEKNMYSS